LEFDKWDLEKDINNAKEELKKCTTSPLGQKLKENANLGHAIKSEQHVTNVTISVLNVVANVLEISFVEGNSGMKSNPDGFATYFSGLGLDASPNKARNKVYASPAKKNKPKKNQQSSSSSSSSTGQVEHLLVVETKPNWKFEVSEGTLFGACQEVFKTKLDGWKGGSEKLPGALTPFEKKVFHSIRQVYGQMTTDRLQFAIFHTYEQWWFLKRDVNGCLFISDVFTRTQEKPSVLHAVVTLLLLAKEGGEMNPGPSSIFSPITKPPPVNAKDKDSSGNRGGGSKKKDSSGNRGGGSEKKVRSGNGGGGSGGGLKFDQIDLRTCSLLKETRLKILLTGCLSVVVKVADPQRYPSHRALVCEMERETEIYMLLVRSGCSDVAPHFIGFGKISCADCLCVEAEGDSFEDIGLENISSDLKHSAVAALERISECGILHGDLAMRNIVRSRHRHESAKFIDFGRAQTTKNTKLLDAQVIALKNMLGIGLDSASVDRREVGSRKVRPALTNRSPLAEL
jgi:uncharacterized membrane protein YgcG